MQNVSILRTPKQILFGVGSRGNLANVVKDLGGRHALIITSQNLINQGFITELEGLIRQGGAISTIWSQVENEPNTKIIEQGVKIIREAGCDFILGCGGGSVMDVAKGIAMLFSNTGKIEDYFRGQEIRQPSLPTILVPTTSGTGAEVTQNALFFLEAEQTKKAISSPLLIPHTAMVDPELTLQLPANITASTGFDALCHAIECYTSKNASPFSDLYAIEAIRLISTHLRDAVYNGSLLSAREGMSKASLYGGLAIVAAGTTAVHALSYPLQGICRIPHGIANAVLLPYVMEFNLVGNISRFAAISEALGQPTDRMHVRDAAQMGVEIVRELSEDVGIPKRMSDIGVTADLIPKFVPEALAVTRLLVNNPRVVRSEDIEAIYRKAL